MNTPTQIDITPGQDKSWSETKTALLWHAPAFSHILYSMLDNCGSRHTAFFTRDCPIAATDGSNLLLNPDTFFKYTLNERVFIVAHEIMHCILNHMIHMHRMQKSGWVVYADGTKLPYVHAAANVAMDLVINDILIKAANERGGLNAPKWSFNEKWLHDTNIATAEDSWLDAYKKLFKKGRGPGGTGKPGKGPPELGPMPQGSSFDQHLPPGTSQGKDPSQAESERNDIEWTTAVAAAAHAARVQGKLPAGLDRVFGEILEPKVDWRDQIRGLFARKVGSGSFDWRKPDRRLIVRDIYSPGRSGHGAGTIIVACDTSGSIGPTELDGFFSEISGILEDVRPKRLFILWTDAHVHRADELDDASELRGIKKQGAPGGGGTDFRPVTRWINEHAPDPDAVVFMTDGFGEFSKEVPSYPWIWASISKPDEVKYPYGDVVNISSGD